MTERDPTTAPGLEQVALAVSSMQGGPFYRLAVRVGLVRNRDSTLVLGLALGFVLWLPLVIVSMVEGQSDALFSLAVVGAHVRLLIAIPLLFICESWLAPRMRAFILQLLRQGVVPPLHAAKFGADIVQLARWRDHWLADLLCLVGAVLMLLLPAVLAVGVSAGTEEAPSNEIQGAIGHGYWAICLTVFRFLLFRWTWRLLLWWLFLWRLTNLPLHLVPTHPDGVGGLGFLETVHLQFLPLVVGISAVLAAGLTEGLIADSITFSLVYPTFLLVFIADLALFVAPLLILSRKLWVARERGLLEYMDFASSYVEAFERKWVRGKRSPDEPLLGTADLQSLADLSNSMGVVRGMRIAPISMRLVINVFLAALIPFLPLPLLQYPIVTLAQGILQRLTGL